MRKRLMLLLVFLLIGLLIGWFIWLEPKADSSSPLEKTQTSADRTSGSETPTPRFTIEDARVLQKAFMSSSKAEQMKALTPERRSAEWHPDLVLPEGATIVIEPKLILGGLDDYRANAVVTSSEGIQVKFIVFLVLDDGRWWVDTTEKVG